MEVLYASGVRNAELRSLCVWDVDLVHRTLTVVHGKGGRSRIVPLGAEACPARISAIVMHIRAEGGSGSTIGIETRRNLRPVTYSKR